MRWLLFLLFTFSTFGAWAGNCDLNTSHIQKGIEGYGTYIFKPVTLSGTLALREGTFTNDDWLAVCLSVITERRDYPDRRSAAQHRV